MHLDSSFLESFAAGHIPERIPSTLNRLKFLALFDVCYDILDHVSRALCLLRSFPNLERVEISIYDDVPNRDPVLRKVKIRDFSGAESEMHFAKILLAHSTVLEKMEIFHNPDISDVGVAMLDELTRCPKASPKVEVVYMPQGPDYTWILKFIRFYPT
ncbi:uncharacterized protein LOC131309387 [Rhododendron vialii]|uniref:uncharacterized protein LOC131309387 n=1 Tax=Rhododendron vialii TaxID=182163 RepID=UPI00265FB688|nr:uncharacterized protein LOC131309387 [Rhododendron vialii]